jgi:hypothetical protein
MIALGVGMLLVPATLLVGVRYFLRDLHLSSGDPSAALSASGRQVVAEHPGLAPEVRGRVVDEDGEPVEGAQVSLVGEGPLFVRQMGQHSGKKGEFVFSQIARHRVLVLAEHEEKGVMISAELTLGPGDVIHDLVLALAPTHAVKGRVVSAEGAPVKGAQVQADGPAWLDRSTTAGDDGTFLLPRMPSLARGVRALAEGFLPGKAALKGTGGDEIVEIRLTREADVAGFVVDPDGAAISAQIVLCEGKLPGQRLASDGEGRFTIPREHARCPVVAHHDAYAPSDPVTADGARVAVRLKAGGSIAGLVIDPSGSPVPSFYVGIESFTPSSSDREFSVRSGASRAFQDDGGAFKLEKLAPGSYVLSVGAEGRGPVRSPSIEVRAGQVTDRIKITLTRGGTVEGQVFEDDPRRPVAGARVSFDLTTSTRAEDRSVTTDADGRFRLENAPPGAFSLRVQHEGHVTRLVTGLRVAPEATLSQDIALHQAGDGGASLEFGGIGALLGQTREGIAFSGVFPSSPAGQAGILQGDLLRRIDGESTEGMSVADAIQRLRGEKGTPVRVGVVRGGSDNVIELRVMRGDIVR